jgi:hypothetical protein
MLIEVKELNYTGIPVWGILAAIGDLAAVTHAERCFTGNVLILSFDTLDAFKINHCCQLYMFFIRSVTFMQPDCNVVWLYHYT